MSYKADFLTLLHTVQLVIVNGLNFHDLEISWVYIFMGLYFRGIPILITSYIAEIQ